MASIFHPTTVKAVPKKATVATVGGKRVAKWTDRKGRAVVAELTPDGAKCRVKSPLWWVEYRDAAGNKCRVPGFKDRGATLQLAARLEKQAEDIKSGKARPSAPPAAAGPEHLADHLSAYRDHQAQRGRSDRHVSETHTLLLGLFADAKLTTPGAVDPESLGRFLAARRKKLNRSARTLGVWVVRLKAFGAWLVKTGRTPANPFAPLVKPDPESDRRHVRRAIDLAELPRLCDAARDSGVTSYGVSGPDRGALYLLAAYTGRRAGSLKSLTPESVLWEGEVPAAVVTRAGRNKNRKEHVAEIPAHVGAELVGWLKGKEPGRSIFAGNADWHRRAAAMLRGDLDRAGIPYRDAAGQVFDFHALRAFYATLLASSGVSQTAATGMMGITDPKLLSNVYAKMGRGHFAAEAAKLPPMKREGK